MSKKTDTKSITFIALLLAVGVVLKALTDGLMRTVFFFLMWDPLTIVNTCIFLKFKEKKYMFAVMVVETVLAATLFATSDIYFLRPFDILITYFICRLLQTKGVKIKYFLSTFFSLLMNIVVIFLIFLMSPDIISTDMTQVDSLFAILKEAGIGLKIFAGVFSALVISLWISIPSCLNMFIGGKISTLADRMVK